MTTTGLFQPSRSDGRADWRVVFDIATSISPGDEVTHDTLLSELETTDRGRMYRAVGRANKELWATQNRSLANVRGVSYRMLLATEHERLAIQYQKQSRRKMSNAVMVMNATDLDALDDQGRAWAIRVQTGLRILAQAMDDHSRRISQNESLIDSLQRRVDLLERKEGAG